MKLGRDGKKNLGSVGASWSGPDRDWIGLLRRIKLAIRMANRRCRETTTRGFHLARGYVHLWSVRRAKQCWEQVWEQVSGQQKKRGSSAAATSKHFLADPVWASHWRHAEQPAAEEEKEKKEEEEEEEERGGVGGKEGEEIYIDSRDEWWSGRSLSSRMKRGEAAFTCRMRCEAANSAAVAIPLWSFHWKTRRLAGGNTSPAGPCNGRSGVFGARPAEKWRPELALPLVSSSSGVRWRRCSGGGCLLLYASPRGAHPYPHTLAAAKPLNRVEFAVRPRVVDVVSSVASPNRGLQKRTALLVVSRTSAAVDRPAQLPTSVDGGGGHGCPRQRHQRDCHTANSTSNISFPPYSPSVQFLPRFQVTKSVAFARLLLLLLLLLPPLVLLLLLLASPPLPQQQLLLLLSFRSCLLSISLAAHGIVAVTMKASHTLFSPVRPVALCFFSHHHLPPLFFLVLVNEIVWQSIYSDRPHVGVDVLLMRTMRASSDRLDVVLERQQQHFSVEGCSSQTAPLRERDGEAEISPWSAAEVVCGLFPRFGQ